MRSPKLSVAAAVLVVTAAACSRSPLTPAPPPKPFNPEGPAQTQQTTIRLVSGWDKSAVGSVSGSVNGVPQRTNEDGVLDGPFSIGARVDIMMPGFLRRATKVGADDITLWPIADDVEADAIRQMLYDWYDDPVPLQHAVSTLEIVLDDRIVAQRQNAASIWQDAGNQVSEITEGRIRFVASGEHAAGRIRIQIDRCSESWVCRNPPYGGGPSWDRTDVTFHIDSPDIAVRPDVALRACVLSAIDFKGSNPLPGLLSQGHPMPTPTDFERRLIRMATLRRSGTTWPDFDF